VLVHCPNCNVDFSPSFRICTTCGKYKPSLDEIRDYLLREASELLSEGKSPEQVRGMFVERGFSDLEADQSTAEARKAGRSINRRHGTSRISQGIALMLLSGMLAAISVVLTAGFFTVFCWGLFACGFALSMAGIIQVVSGRHVE
jgi:predicted phage tail protein